MLLSFKFVTDSFTNESLWNCFTEAYSKILRVLKSRFICILWYWKFLKDLNYFLRMSFHYTNKKKKKKKKEKEKEEEKEKGKEKEK